MAKIGRAPRLGALFLLLLLAASTPAAPPVLPRPSPKPTAPIALEFRRVTGGAPGENATLLLEATPLVPGGRLDLDIAVPEGLRVVSGSTAASDAGPDGKRLLDVTVEVPPDGVFRVLARASLTLPGGARYFRARILTLPEGAEKPEPEAPLVPYGDGAIIETPGEAGP